MKIKDIQNIVKNDDIVLLVYDHSFSQDLVGVMVNSFDQEAEKFAVKEGIKENIATIIIELSQNIMNYSKTAERLSREIQKSGLLAILKDKESNYSIQTQNIVSIDDKEKMLPKLIDVTTLDRKVIRKKYRESRKLGHDSHDKGGGLGFYEIAKRSQFIEYSFENIDDDKLFFNFKAITIINNKNED